MEMKLRKNSRNGKKNRAHIAIFNFSPSPPLVSHSFSDLTSLPERNGSDDRVTFKGQGQLAGIFCARRGARDGVGGCLQSIRNFVATAVEQARS